MNQIDACTVFVDVVQSIKKTNYMTMAELLI